MLCDEASKQFDGMSKAVENPGSVVPRSRDPAILAARRMEYLHSGRTRVVDVEGFFDD
jgi:hypothetical protein